ncbi:hypothetical protein OHT93_02410 [Streptomyces sp. NBC_00191]|uniref:hypothetical protein n=1 Tax=Streptomyces sp. NBC_00191 TaxID=2975674 RepID=UPI0032531155
MGADTLAAPFGDPDLATYDFAPWLHNSRGFRSRLEVGGHCLHLAERLSVAAQAQ